MTDRVRFTDGTECEIPYPCRIRVSIPPGNGKRGVLVIEPLTRIRIDNPTVSRDTESEDTAAISRQWDRHTSRMASGAFLTGIVPLALFRLKVAMLAAQEVQQFTVSPWANLGAVGIMGLLLLWLVTKGMPNLLLKFSEESKAEREAFLSELREERKDFASALISQRNDFRQELTATRDQSRLLAESGHQAVAKLSDSVSALSSQVSSQVSSWSGSN